MAKNFAGKMREDISRAVLNTAKEPEPGREPKGEDEAKVDVLMVKPESMSTPTQTASLPEPMLAIRGTTGPSAVLVSESTSTSTPISTSTVVSRTTPHRNAKNPHETRTKRANFVLRPSLYESLRVIADQKEISINDAADEALSAYIRANQESLSL